VLSYIWVSTRGALAHPHWPPKKGLPVGEEFQMRPRCGGWEEGDAARISDEWMGGREGAKRCCRIIIYRFPLVEL